MNKNFVNEYKNNSPSIRRLRSRVLMPASIDEREQQRTTTKETTTNSSSKEQQPISLILSTSQLSNECSASKYQSMEEFLTKHDMLLHLPIFLKERITLNSIIIIFLVYLMS